jgi:hypothetical protein
MGNRAFDKLFGTVVFGFMLLVLPFCAGWWISYLLGSGSEAILVAGIILGILVGIALNLLLLKKTVTRMYLMPTWVMTGLLALYSVGIFGFFMGVPVFNVLAGILSGIYVGRQAKALGYDAAHFSARIKKAQAISLLLLLMACAASATLALSDSHTAANLQGMLSLNFAVTTPLLTGIILIGGAMLLAAQFLLTKVSAKLAYGS